MRSEQPPTKHQASNGGREFTITRHALDRFLQRTPPDNLGKEPEKTIKKLFKKAFRIKFSPKHQIIRLLNNDVQEAEYYYYESYIFVCAAKKIITIEMQEDRKFGIDLFKCDKGV